MTRKTTSHARKLKRAPADALNVPVIYDQQPVCAMQMGADSY